jgi:hypothetical protein
MFTRISMKTLGAAALSLSLLAGTLVGPVSTAFAKPMEDKITLKTKEAQVTRHSFRSLVRAGSFRKGEFFKSYRLGNRSISQK